MFEKSSCTPWFSTGWAVVPVMTYPTLFAPDIFKSAQRFKKPSGHMMWIYWGLGKMRSSNFCRRELWSKVMLSTAYMLDRQHLTCRGNGKGKKENQKCFALA